MGTKGSMACRCAALGAAALVWAACSTTVETKRAILTKALDSPDERQGFFEATLRILDEHPEYVDELFQLARKHPETFQRLLARTAAQLSDPQLAALTAEQLVQHPDSLYAVLVANLEAVADHPEAKKAIARAIEDRAPAAADAMISRPSAVRRISGEMMVQARKTPAAQDAFLASLRDRREVLAQQLASSPPTLLAMVSELLAIGARDPAVARLLVGTTVSWLGKPVLARTTAQALVGHPDVLQSMLLGTLTAVRSNPTAEAALADLIAQQPGLVAEILVHRPEALAAAMTATVDRVRGNQRAEAALLSAIRDKKAELTRLLLSDPKTAAAIIGQVAEAGLESTFLADQLRRLIERHPPEGAGGSGKAK
ncbi:MAG TPA: hypothetical protein VE782_14455 [Myxococcaceae bacterium]|nr:hypothetical protein [Myxococcaceae bacterium]